MTVQFKSGLIIFAFAILSWSPACLGQSAQSTPVPGSEQSGSQPQIPEHQSLPDHLPGSVSGTVGDRSGAVIAGARVRLTQNDPTVKDQASQNQTSTVRSSNQDVLSDGDGKFSFAIVAPGPFTLTIAATGFAAQTSSGILHSGEVQMVPQVALQVAEAVTEVQVSLTRTEVAEQEMKVEEKQRVLGIVPNFYVSYISDPVPLTSKQKFNLAWKTVVDPVTFLLVGGSAGVEQAQNHFAAYGQGAQGYGKRFGANYADTVAGTFIGGALLPSLLKQDPRYFYKGSGSKTSRFFYAIGNAVICKGDNGHWQTNYSNILGSLAAGGISNLYYPEQDRSGAGLTFENATIGIGTSAASNLLQEFIIRKFTPKVPKNDPSNP